MGEQEPLLGRAGDASQQDGLPLYHNLIIGMSSFLFVFCVSKGEMLMAVLQALV